MQRPIEAASAEADLWVLAQRETGNPAVLKLYRYGIQPKREILEAIHKLQHASVVRVLKSGVLDGRSFEIQEFIVHGSLASVVGDGPLPPEQLLALRRTRFTSSRRNVNCSPNASTGSTACIFATTAHSPSG